jgi:cell wall-associated NlpC family hydrolase
VFFGPRERADHVAFWLGDGRILHATAREGVHAVVEEPLENVQLEHELRFARL